MGIKGISFHKLRGRRMFLTLITTLCATFLFWAPEKTPLLTNLLPPKEHLDLIPRVIDPLGDENENPQVGKELFEMPKLESGSKERDGIGGDRMAEFASPKGSKIFESKEAKSPVTMKKVIDPFDGGNSQVDEGLFEMPKLESREKEKDGIGGDRIAELTMPKRSNNMESKEMEPPIITNKTIHPVDGKNPELDKELLEMPTLESRNLESKEGKSPIIVKKECNYAKGEWVADSRRPLYSGAKCKQWLSEMWACRLTKRTDFSFEAFRWKPDHCKMPEFRGSAFLKRMKGKTLAFVGDSLGRQQFQSLMCMVTSGKYDKDVKDVGEEYGLFGARGSERPTGWAYRFPRTNTTILYHWSATLCELEPLNLSDPLTSIAMHIDRPALFLREYLRKIDVVVLNTGHHWNRGKLNGNRWTMYADGSPVVDRHLRMMGNAKNLTIHSVVRWLDKQLPSHPHLRAFFRSLSPRHFFDGDWNTGGSCGNTSPLAHGNRVPKDVSGDSVVAGAVKGTGVRFLDVTGFSQLRDEAHISKYSIKASPGVHDCLHWCLPGVPDAWNEVLFAQL